MCPMLSEHKLTRRRPASLALRVTALVCIATTLVFLTFGCVVVQSLEHHFAQQDARELEAVASAVSVPLRQTSAGADGDLLRQQLARAVSGHHGISYAVYDKAGNTIYATPGPDLSRLADTRKPIGRLGIDDLTIWKDQLKSYRGATLQPQGDNGTAASSYRIVVAMDIGFHLEFLSAFRRMLWWATCIVLCIALVVAYLAVQWGHLPIRKVNAEIRAIRSSKLHVRLNPLEVPIELADLVISFNEMLARIEDGFNSLSNFSADIAHELRTPVTNLITQTEVALGQPRSAAEYREVLYSNLEEFERMSRMIGDMLFLAQTENDPYNLRLVEIDVGNLLRGLFDYFEALADDRNITLCLKGHASPVHADKEMLLRALSNLLSNAIRHAPCGTSVEVIFAEDDRHTTLSVENPGEPIPEAAIPKVFDRFFRVDPARQRHSAGAGLGLAIVKSIAQVHGGSVQVTSNARLTRFSFTLPRLS